MRALAGISSVVLLACGGSARTAGFGPCGSAAPVSGRATTYAGTSAGACMFPSGLALYAAVGPATFAGSAACGACVEVTGPVATVTLEVTDLCPECAATALDLSPGAWDAVTGSAPAGTAPVSWRLVPCLEAGPVRFVASSGVNPWYASVVVQDHRYPIAAVEMLPAGAASWLSLARDGANQWIGSASGAGFGAPLDFRATDVFGRTTTTTVAMATLDPGAEARAPQLDDACGG